MSLCYNNLMIRARTDASLNSLTKLEAERESHLRAEEEAERLDVIGQESDLKAAPWVSKEAKERARQDRLQFDQDMDVLTHLRSQKHSKVYYRYLVTLLYRFAREEQISRKYPIEVLMDDKGIVVRIKGTRYLGAFKPSGLPSYDRNYCKILAVKLGNTVARLEGYRAVTDTGIILPDEEDQKVYG